MHAISGKDREISLKNMIQEVQNSVTNRKHLSKTKIEKELQKIKSRCFKRDKGKQFPKRNSRINKIRFNLKFTKEVEEHIDRIFISRLRKFIHKLSMLFLFYFLSSVGTLL